MQTLIGRYNTLVHSIESSGEYLNKNLAEKGLKTSYTCTMVCPPERGDNSQAFSMKCLVLKFALSAWVDIV